jgi:hypothetical protein
VWICTYSCSKGGFIGGLIFPLSLDVALLVVQYSSIRSDALLGQIRAAVGARELQQQRFRMHPIMLRVVCRSTACREPVTATDDRSKSAMLSVWCSRRSDERRNPKNKCLLNAELPAYVRFCTAAAANDENNNSRNWVIRRETFVYVYQNIYTRHSRALPTGQIQASIFSALQRRAAAVLPVQKVFVSLKRDSFRAILHAHPEQTCRPSLIFLLVSYVYECMSATMFESANYVHLHLKNVKITVHSLL